MAEFIRVVEDDGCSRLIAVTRIATVYPLDSTKDSICALETEDASYDVPYTVAEFQAAFDNALKNWDDSVYDVHAEILRQRAVADAVLSAD